MKPLSRSICLLMASICLTPVAVAEQAVTLKQQWQVGKCYSRTMTMEQSSTTTKGEVKVTLNAEMTLGVTPHEDNTRKRIAVRYTRMSMELDAGGQKMSFDSAQPGGATGPLSGTAAAMLDKEFRVITDAGDRVSEIENLAEITKAAGAGDPMSAALINKEAITRAIRQNGLMALPGKPVAPGDSWPFSIEIPLRQVGTVGFKGIYVFKGMAVHQGVTCAEITFSGTLSSDLSGADGNSPAARMNVKIESGTISGTVWFDNVLGAARTTDLTQEMTMSMADLLKPGELRKLPIKQTIHTALTKVEALP